MIRARARLQPRHRFLLERWLVVVRVLDHQVDAFVWIEYFFLLWDLTVVVHFHASVDLDTGLAWGWRVSLLLLVVLQSLIESSLFGGHSSLWSAVRRLASAKVGIRQVHLARVWRVDRTLVAQILHLHLSSWRWSLVISALVWRLVESALIWRLVKSALVWLHLAIVWSSVVLEVLGLSLVHIHVVRRRTLVHAHIILRLVLIRGSCVLLLRVSLCYCSGLWCLIWSSVHR